MLPGDEDTLMAAVLDAGGDDLRDDEDNWEVLSPVENFQAVLEAVKGLGIEPDAAEISKTRSPRAVSSSTTNDAMSRPSGTSTLFSATRRGRSSSPPYRPSSFSITSRSSTGFRPGSMVAMSRTWTIAAHRSMWRRKSWPSPRPSLAPSMSPGTSATVNVVSPAVTTPRLGTRVVNG